MKPCYALAESDQEEQEMSDLRQRLDGGEVVVLDGTMGTELEKRGVPMDDAAWSAAALMTHPDTANRCVLPTSAVAPRRAILAGVETTIVPVDCEGPAESPRRTARCF